MNCRLTRVDCRAGGWASKLGKSALSQGANFHPYFLLDTRGAWIQPQRGELSRPAGPGQRPGSGIPSPFPSPALKGRDKDRQPSPGAPPACISERCFALSGLAGKRQGLFGPRPLVPQGGIVRPYGARFGINRTILPPSPSSFPPYSHSLRLHCRAWPEQAAGKGVAAALRRHMRVAEIEVVAT